MKVLHTDSEDLSARECKVHTSAGPIVLSALKVAYSPEFETLFVADVHLGKAQSFRRFGVPVPSGTTEVNLQRLSAALDRFQPKTLAVLGDFLHSAQGKSELVIAQVQAWIEVYPWLKKLLVRGNHDDRAGDPPKSFGFEVVDEPYALGGFALCHYPQKLEGHFTLAGHVHPAVKLKGKGKSSARLPCFQKTQHGLVLPAFGEFTGMHCVEAKDSEMIFAIS